MVTSAVSKLRPLRAFLSHRYGSPAINLRFHDLFSRAALVQFSVDFGELATNVTRLERLIREADAFIGIYPLSAAPQEPVTTEIAQQQSRYFRLELDLAMRARVPMIVFADARYGRVLQCPGWVHQYAFDAQDLEARTESPRLQAHALAFKSFADAALAYQAHRVHQWVGQRERTRVGLLLAPADYPKPVRRALVERIEQAGRDCIELPWPPILDGSFHAIVGELDWIVLDVGDRGGASAVAAYLHGACIPALRLLRIRPGKGAAGQLRQTLFGAQEVGYPKDIVQWQEAGELMVAVDARIRTLLMPQRLIGDSQDAVAYFQSASLSKEVIFVSYAGADATQAKPIIQALKKTFKTVFDYKDGESIVPGRPWLDEIFNTLSRAAAGVMLLSPAYLASGNCKHEASEMVARQDDGRLALLPVRLTDAKLDTPTWLGQNQHARLSQLTDGAAEVSRLVKQLLADKAKAPPG